MALAALGAFPIGACGSGHASGCAMAILSGAVVSAEVDFTAFFVRRHVGQAMFGRLYGGALRILLVGSGIGSTSASASFSHLGSYRSGAPLFAVGPVLVLLALALPKPPTSKRHG